MRNTVVRATFKVNGKPQILGNPLTPWPIDLIFDMGDYVGDITPQAKNGKNRPRRGRPGKGVKCEGQIWVIFLFFYDFLAAAGDHIFASIGTVFAPDDMFRWGLIS